MSILDHRSTYPCPIFSKRVYFFLGSPTLTILPESEREQKYNNVLVCGWKEPWWPSSKRMHTKHKKEQKEKGLHFYFRHSLFCGAPSWYMQENCSFIMKPTINFQIWSEKGFFCRTVPNHRLEVIFGEQLLYPACCIHHIGTVTSSVLFLGAMTLT